MSEIISLFTVFSPHLSTTTLRQFCDIVFAVLAMARDVAMRNISRWTPQGGSYRTVQRFFIVDSVITYTLSIGAVRKPHLPEVESVYLFLEFTITQSSLG